MSCFPLEALEGKAGRCGISLLYLRYPHTLPAQATSMELPAPSFGSTYWRSHESRRASGTWVPLGKEKGAMGSFASVLTQLHATLCLDVHSQDLQGTLDEVEGKSLSLAQPLAGWGQ